MKFPYQPAVIAPPDGGDYILILRPYVPFSVVGERDLVTLIGLADTGSDITILPRSAAEQLGILLRPATGPSALAFGGQPIHSSRAKSA